MGNLLSTEDIDETQYEERVKPERKKRKTRARTAKRRTAPVVEEEEDTSSGFNLFGGFSGEEEDPDSVVENIKMDVEPEPEYTKPKRKRRGATISRRKKVAWEEEEE